MQSRIAKLNRQETKRGAAMELCTRRKNSCSLSRFFQSNLLDFPSFDALVFSLKMFTYTVDILIFTDLTADAVGYLGPSLNKNTKAHTKIEIPTNS